MGLCELIDSFLKSADCAGYDNTKIDKIIRTETRIPTCYENHVTQDIYFLDGMNLQIRTSFLKRGVRTVGNCLDICKQFNGDYPRICDFLNASIGIKIPFFRERIARHLLHIFHY
jgi:hypothetical protein